MASHGRPRRKTAPPKRGPGNPASAARPRSIYPFANAAPRTESVPFARLPHHEPSHDEAGGIHIRIRFPERRNHPVPSALRRTQ